MAATFQKLGQTTLSSSAGNISVTSISQTYDALMVYASLRGDNAGVRVTGELRPNNSTSSLYRSEIYLENDIFGVEVNNANGYIGAINAASSNSNLFTNFTCIFPNYKSSDHKVLYGRFAQPHNNGSISYSLWNTFLTWQNSSPINSIYIYPTSGNIVSGSELTVYGLKYS